VDVAAVAASGPASAAPITALVHSDHATAAPTNSLRIRFIVDHRLEALMTRGCTRVPFERVTDRESIKTDLLGWCETVTEVTNPRQITDFLRSLRAVREFKRQPIPDEVVQDILEVARWSGSASNRQFAQIIVVRKPESLQVLSGAGGFAGHLRGSAMAMIRVQPGDWPGGETFDEGRLAERIMLGAAAHGVGSSIGWFSPEGRAKA